MSNDDTPTTDRVGTFPALQAKFNATRRARHPMDVSAREGGQVRVPLMPNKLQRRDSKGGLRAMFGRTPKTEKVAVLPIVEEPAPATSTQEKSEKETPEPVGKLNASFKKGADLTPATPAKPTPKPSRINMRTKSVKESRPAPKPSPKSTKSSPRSIPPRTSATWDPPPLFQAYPQAIKHAQLSASSLSADSILRISNHKRNNSLRETGQARGNGGAQDEAAAKKAEKAKNKHRRQISGSISKADWTQKIFVLVTSGYLLQYAGEGSFDRLPEKMMQLGKDSVAFASDVIPGKHWVLQISQAMDADGTPAADSRSLLSRLTFRGADYRRTATSLLLVLNSAEEMDSWLAVVRREIEALGGKKHVSETGKPKPDDKVMQLRAQPSHRYLVQRDPDKFSNPNSPMTPAFGPPPWKVDEDLQSQLESAASTLARPSSSNRPLTGHQSISNSIASHSIISRDGHQLENLRDSANRLSYMSSGQRTLITSQGSSTASSPTRESMSTFDDFPSKVSNEDIRPRPNAFAINERRRSMQTMQIPILEAPPKGFRHSTFGLPSRPERSLSPINPTPNFIVPSPSNKRFSAIKNTTEAPPIPTIVTTTPSKNMLKGMRKAPPPALHVSQPLSPVTDSPSTKRPPPVFTPTESSFKIVPQARASVVEISARSYPPTPKTPTPPKRMSSLMPLTSPELSHVEFQFPRRNSSMLALHDAENIILDPPSRPAPLPPAALTVPLPVSPAFPEEEAKGPNPVPEIEQETLSLLPTLPTTKKLRRPNSMQIQPHSTLSPTTPSSMHPKSAKSLHSGHPSPSAASSEALDHGAVSPAHVDIQRLKAQTKESKTSLQNRRSMPMLVNGPPPAPPPDCALPPLPPGSGGLRSSMVVKNSTVKV
jgi:hypothetical protein